MKDNIRDERNYNQDNIHNERTDDQSNIDQDKLRSSTMNEMIRETSGDPDRSLNDLSHTDEHHSDDLDINTRNTRREARDTDVTQGMSYTPNDTSGVRSGGTTDMDDQAQGGAGSNTGRRRGSGSNIRPKRGTTGSDYDGQHIPS